MVPEGWRDISATEICERISVGIVVTPAAYYVSEGDGVRAFRSANVREGAVSNHNWVYISAAGNEINKKSILKTGDILIVRTGYPGTACVVPTEYDGSNCIDLIFARPDKSAVDPVYLCAFTNSDLGKRQVLGGQGGLAQKHFNVGEYKKLRLFLPPLPEQKRIAEILSTWDVAIETTEKLLANAEAQKRALMQQLLTGRRRLKGFEGREWKRRTLGELGEPYGGLSGKSGDDFGQGKPFITYMTVFSRSRVDVNAMQFVEIGPNEKQHRVRKGDIFFTVSSETPDEVGMSSVLLDDVGEAYLNSFCFGYRLNSLKTLRPEYARHLLRGPQFRRDIRKLAQGATRYNLSKRQLMHLHVELPPFEEQERIVRILDAEDKKVEAYRRDIEMLRAEKRSLIQQLLTGKRRVRP